MNLDAVGRLVAHLDEPTLHVVGEGGEVDELVTRRAGVRAQAVGLVDLAFIRLEPAIVSWLPFTALLIVTVFALSRVR